MQTIRWTRLLALGMLAVPLAGRAQAPALKGPQPKVTELATIPGVDVDEAVRMPNGHVIIFGAFDDQREGYIASYDVTTKRVTPIARGWDYELVISPLGNRIAYSRTSEDGKSDMIWTIALDPATGKPTGPAQRLATSESSSPSFSPDGKLVAFEVGHRITPSDSGHTQSLTVVPPTGGTPRVVARFDKSIEGTSWSADGKWIYVTVANNAPERVMSVERVPSAGGKSAALMSHPGVSMGSIDGQVAFYSPVGASAIAGRAAWVTAAGGRGEFSIPVGTVLTASGQTPRPVLTNTSFRSALHILNMDDGKIIDVPFDGANAANPAWSTDQKRLAFAAGEGQDQEIVVMNADGSGLRRYSVKGARPRPHWSPDGSTLIYHADSSREIRVLNLATGASRVIASGPAGTYFNNILWLPDGKSFRAMTFARRDGAPALESPTGLAIVEIRLDGNRRVVRDVLTDFPGAKVAFLPSARQAVVEYGDSALAGPNRFLLVPLDGGAPRAISIPPLEPGTLRGWVTGYSEKWFALFLRSSDPTKAYHPVGMLVMSTGTDTSRVIRFAEDQFNSSMNVVLPDGNVVAVGKASADKDYSVYSMPTDGRAPRVIAHSKNLISVMSGWGSNLSTDGKRLAFFSTGAPTTHLFDIDLTPIMQLVKKP